MAEFRLAPKADIDLESIWLYSLEQWGRGQADSYTDVFFITFDELAPII